MAPAEERVELSYHDATFTARRLAGTSGLRTVVAFVRLDPDRVKLTRPAPGSEPVSEISIDRDARGDITRYSQVFAIASNAEPMFRFWRDYMLKNGWEELSSGEQQCVVRLAEN